MKQWIILATLMRYFDDTLVNAHHVFVLTDKGSTYFNVRDPDGPET